MWIDDQLDVIRTLASLLSPLKADVTCVGSASDAIDLLEHHNYDLILVDLAMPPDKWGGLWFLDAVRKLERKSPIVVVSGEGSQQETIKALRLGAIDYITKETLEQELVSRVQQVLNHVGESGERRREATRELIRAGESEDTEFKSTLRWNLMAKRLDTAIELTIIKSIAGFMNSAGGTLLVGVDDAGQIVGLEDDRFQDDDKLQLHFWNRIRDSIGSEHAGHVHATILKIDGKSILRVDCRASPRPVYVRWKHSGKETDTDLFFVRTGPKTEMLDIRQAVQYISSHFKDT